MGSVREILTTFFKDTVSSYCAACAKPGSDPFEIHDELLKFASFVKDKEKAPGKHGNHKTLPYVSYSLRTLAIYISDVVETLKLEPSFKKMLLENGKDDQKTDFAYEVRYLGYIDSVLDIHKCADDSLVQDMGPILNLAKQSKT